MPSIFKIKGLEKFQEHIENKMEDKFSDIVKNLRKEVENLEGQVDNFDDLLYWTDKLSSFFSDTDLDTYVYEASRARTLIQDQSSRLIDCHKILTTLASDSKHLVTDGDINNLIWDIEGELLPENHYDLKKILIESGWRGDDITLAERVAGVSFKNKNMHLASDNSAHNCIIMTDCSGYLIIREDYLRIYSGESLIIMHPTILRRPTDVPGLIFRFEDAENEEMTFFHPSEMVDYFKDLSNPTKEEILMYEMASGKRYDIYRWAEIFSLSKK